MHPIKIDILWFECEQRTASPLFLRRFIYFFITTKHFLFCQFCLCVFMLLRKERVVMLMNKLIRTRGWARFSSCRLLRAICKTFTVPFVTSVSLDFFGGVSNVFVLKKRRKSLWKLFTFPQRKLSRWYVLCFWIHDDDGTFHHVSNRREKHKWVKCDSNHVFHFVNESRN